MNKRIDHSTETGLPESKRGQDAIVLGGSLAGLLAARVLSDHFKRVTLIERDSFSTSPEARRGTPQANHVHALLPQGRLIIEQLFPDLHKQMMADGALLLDIASDIAWLTPQGWGVSFQSDLEMLAFTRPLLDLHVRRRLESNPYVRILHGTEIVKLIEGQNDSISGVVVRTTAADGDAFETKLYGDLVVDATGRASRAPQWLAELGYPALKDTTVNAFLGYASRLYQIPDGFTADWKCAFVQAAPPERKRGGFLCVVEGDRWLVTLIGGGRDYPPQDEQGFLEFARSLVVPVIYDAIKNATPLSAIKTHRGTENRLRHFDKLDHQPRNFVALGDAVCAFNPVYGQGMTIAAMGAMTLDSCLRKWKAQDELFARRFQKRLAKVVSAPWMLATSEDYRYRETEGGSAGRVTRFMHRYMDQVLKVSTFDPIVRHVLLQAFGMLVPPSALFQPKVSLRLIRETFATAVRPKRYATSVSGRRMVYETAE